MHSPTSELPTIPLSELKLGKKVIGVGGFAIVRKGMYLEKIVAVKTFCLPSAYEIIQGECVFNGNHPDYFQGNELDSEEMNRAMNNFVMEAQKMQSMKHPNIVKFIGFVSENLSIVMEYLPDGTLYHHITEGKEMTWKDRYQISLDIAEGMYYLHSNKGKDNIPKLEVFHQDLKSANILLCHDRAKRLRGKISDFGLSVFREEQIKRKESQAGNSFQLAGPSSQVKSETSAIATQTQLNDAFVAHRGGTRVYMAPELFQSQKFTKACDVYSYGVILLEVCTFRPPQEVHNMLARLKKSDIPTEMKYLIKECLRLDPTKRPSFHSITRKLKTDHYLTSIADYLVKYKASTSKTTETELLSSCLASEMDSTPEEIIKQAKSSKLADAIPRQVQGQVQGSQDVEIVEINKKRTCFLFQRKYRLVIVATVLWVGLLVIGLQFGLQLIK